ncbi:hypothetical protein LCGC14_0370080 [marine sediment metagenome]|uniref:Uncharacterized protein n=1 Tax=marine sediment metagenome TaxID=412755 RepID=A0A0F9TBE6_9ZZZZ
MYIYKHFPGTGREGWFPSPRQDNSIWLTGDLWTVGYYNDGQFYPESDHEIPEAAAERVHYLNGGQS